jgi:hypothetical protein
MKQNKDKKRYKKIKKFKQFEILDQEYQSKFMKIQQKVISALLSEKNSDKLMAFHCAPSHQS